MRTYPAIGSSCAQTVAIALLVLVSTAGCNRETSDVAVSNGQAALQAGDYRAAIRHLKRASKLNPRNEIILYNLGMAHFLALDYKAAEKAFDAADLLSLDGDTAAIEALAETRRRAGDYDGAIRAISDRAFNKVYRRPDLVAALAGCEMEKGHSEYAQGLLDQALASNGKEPVALFNMAVLMQKPQFDDPVKSAEMYIRFLKSPDSENYPAERQRAIQAIKAIGASRSDELQMKIDDLLIKAHTAKSKNEAVNLLLDTVLLDQSNPDALHMLAQALEAAGRTTHAELIRASFRMIFPDDPRSTDSR